MQLTYRITRRFLFALAALLAVAGCDAVNSRPPAAPTLPTGAALPAATPEVSGPFAPAKEGVEWLAHYLGKERVGHGERRVTKEADGAFRVLKKDQLRFRRGQDVNEMSVENAHVESPDGALRSIEAKLALGPEPQRISGVVRGEKLAIRIEKNAAPAASVEIAWGADVRGVDAIERTLAAQPLKPGETRSLRGVEIFTGSVVIERVSLAAWREEEVELLGDRKERLLRIVATADLGAGAPLRTTIWTDAVGRVVKSAAPLGDLTLYSYAVSEEEAKRSDEGTPPDLLLRSMVSVERPLPGVYEASEMKYRVTLSGDDPLEKLFPTDPHQEWTPGPDRSGELVVRRLSPSDSPGPWATAADPPTDLDRKSSVWIESDDARVKELATAAAPADVEGEKLALALETFVHKAIEKRNFTQAMDTAAGVARRREGDCTEHAVLLAGLARARGLPARVAVGLVYSDRPQSGFYYHMWTEVYVDRWVPLDATLARGGITAAHLKLAATGLDDGGALASFLPVARVMGKLAIQAEPLAPTTR